MTNPTNAVEKPATGCGWDVWIGQTPNNHFWAFFYFCKRQGDRVTITRNSDGTVNLHRAHVEASNG